LKTVVRKRKAKGGGASRGKSANAFNRKGQRKKKKDRGEPGGEFKGLK